MAIKTIRQYPDPVLRTPADLVPKVTKEIKKLIKDLFDTMHEAHGIGLAAPQVGISKRVIVVDVSSREEESEPLALVNPTVVSAEGEAVDEEGCLSFPSTVKMPIKRAAKVRVVALSREGKSLQLEASGLLSRALQHEIDHLNGVLFIDRLTFSQKLKFTKTLQALDTVGSSRS